MTATATRPHIAAVGTLLTGAGLTVLPGGEGAPVAPCVVLWASPGTPTPGSIGLVDSDLVVEVTTVAVGGTSDQCMWVADKITAALNRAKPTVSGRTVHAMTLSAATSVRREDDLAAPLFSASLVWRLHTT